MPAEDPDHRLPELAVSKEWLHKQLRADPARLVVLDCRGSHEFAESHIRQAVNFTIPSIMLRRLAAGKIDLSSTVRSRHLRDRIVGSLKENLFVVYGEALAETKTDTVQVLARRLLQDGCRVFCLQDGFAEFRCSYPEWCESTDDSLAAADTDLPLMGLRSLRISTYGSRCHQERCVCEPRCETYLGSQEDALVEILPHLFLGNAANSQHLETLTKHNIKYILNVTPDLPNVFESAGNIKYMKIPITDHWSQNLLSYFPKSIEFIDEARSHEKGILVHCVAGVSRSVTVTVAYLMARLNLSLNDAFSLVRARKANIAPNFHFMEQLHRFEQELVGKAGSGTTYLSPVTLGQSPDSGIEFDRWTPGSTQD